MLDIAISEMYFHERLSKPVFISLLVAKDTETSECMLENVYLNFLKQTVHLGCNKNALFLYHSSHVILQQLANQNTYLQRWTISLQAPWLLYHCISVDKFAFSA